MSRWRAFVGPIVRRVLAEVRGGDERAVRAAIRAGCPFTARGYLRNLYFDEARRQRGEAPPLHARGVRRKGYAREGRRAQGALFEGPETRRIKREEQREMPHTPKPADVDPHEWMADMRTEHFGHPSAVEGCPGCDSFGLCAYHGPPHVEGVKPMDREQAEAWTRGGYACVIPAEKKGSARVRKKDREPG